MTEIRALTGARGIAAWLVVLYHLRLSIAGLPPGVERVLAKGYLAVDFFFLLSGFVIWLAWHERLRDPGQIPRFLLKRIARVWPLHLLMLAAAASITLALVATGRAPASGFPYAELPFHLLLLQAWGAVPPLAWNDPAWSISAELAAYLLFPLLALAIDWRRWPTPWLLLAAALPLAALAWAMRGNATLGQELARFAVVRCLAEFATGTVVAALWLRWRGASALTPGLVALAAMVAAAAGAPETLVVPAGFAAGLLALALGNGALLGGRALHRLGQVSYATYLSHYVLWQAFKLALVRDASAVPPGLILLYLALVLVASLLLYDRFERPAQAWVERLALPRERSRRLVG